MTRRPLAVMRLASLLLVALVLGATSAAHGQSYPSRPVRIIVPYPPGGSSDIAARTIAAALAQGAQQPFIIDNRPGAGGIIGLQAAQAAAADGHTLLATPAVLLSMVESQRAGGTSVPAGLETLVPIAQLGVDSQVLVVGAHRPWRSARELLEAARAAPGKLSYASSGQGSTSHLAMQALVLANALEMTHIPYKGMADATAGLTGGHVDAAVVSAPGIVSHVQAGRLRALAVVGTARSPVLGDVPTIADVGISAAVVPSWIGLFAPAGTPAAVQTRLHELIVTALRDPTAVASLERLMLRIEPRTGDDFRRIVARDMRIVSALARGVAPAASDLARATPAPSPAVAAAPPVAPAPAAAPPRASTLPPAAVAAAPPPSPLPSPAIAPTAFGRYHALVIGNQAYRHLTKLKTPVADARAVAELLRRDYGFQNVRLLTDATRADMVRAFDDLRRQLTEQDNLLIYYAGHGWLDREVDRGYWLGVDAEEDTRANWLSNADITDTLRALKAKHVLIVADSCYSGTLVRDVGIRSLDAADLGRLARKRARTVLTSGGSEPVMDEGGAGHSVFARAFIETLREAPRASDLTSLFGGLRRRVLLRAEQTPQYGDVRLSGHDGGDFIFLRAP